MITVAKRLWSGSSTDFLTSHLSPSMILDSLSTMEKVCASMTLGVSYFLTDFLKVSYGPGQRSVESRVRLCHLRRISSG